MPTITSNSLAALNDTDARFRTWATFVRDTFLLGWVQTSDTGQMNFSTVLTPAAVNTKAGYAIFRMNDTLQATAPVFVRIDFGTSTNTNVPGMWVTIGTGSDGAGNITNKKFDGGANTAATTFYATSTASTLKNGYGSAAPNRVSMALFVAVANYIMMLTIERTKDINGADTAEGVLMAYGNTTNGINNYRYIVMDGGVSPPPETNMGFQYILAWNNPSAFNNFVGVGIPVPMKGIGMPAGTNVAVVNTNDFAAEGGFTISLYGVNVNFQHLNSVAVYNATSASVISTHRMCIRYD